MKKLISQIHNAIQNSRKTVEFLNQISTFHWLENYPIALINEANRITDATQLQILNSLNFFDAEGFSKNSYTREELRELQENAPFALKNAYCLCLKKPQERQLSFREKYRHDKWKKVEDANNFELLMELSKFDDSASSKEIETELRDIMRSRKEIPSLKAIGFVWIVTLPKTTQIQDILEHYFSDNHIYVEKGRKVTYITWGEKLATINMRYFVNTP